MRGKGPALRLGVVEAGALFAATERSQQRPKARSLEYVPWARGYIPGLGRGIFGPLSSRWRFRRRLTLNSNLHPGPPARKQEA